MNTFWAIVLVVIIVCLISVGITSIKDFIKIRKRICAVKSGMVFALSVSIILSFFVFPDYFLSSLSPPFISAALSSVVGALIGLIISGIYMSTCQDKDMEDIVIIKEYAEKLMKILNVDYFKNDNNYIFICVHEALPKDNFDKIIIYSLLPGSPTSDEEAKLIITLNGGDMYPFKLLKDPHYMLKYTIEKRFKSNGDQLTKIIYSYLNENLNNASVTLLSKNQIGISDWKI